MPRARPLVDRERIIARQLAGVSLPQIAAALGLPRGTVRAIWRPYRDRGAAGFAPDSAARGRRVPRHTPAVTAALAASGERPIPGGRRPAGRERRSGLNLIPMRRSQQRRSVRRYVPRRVDRAAAAKR